MGIGRTGSYSPGHLDSASRQRDAALQNAARANSKGRLAQGSNAVGRLGSRQVAQARSDTHLVPEPSTRNHKWAPARPLGKRLSDNVTFAQRNREKSQTRLPVPAAPLPPRNADVRWTPLSRNGFMETQAQNREGGNEYDTTRQINRDYEVIRPATPDTVQYASLGGDDRGELPPDYYEPIPGDGPGDYENVVDNYEFLSGNTEEANPPYEPVNPEDPDSNAYEPVNPENPGYEPVNPGGKTPQEDEPLYEPVGRPDNT